MPRRTGRPHARGGDAGRNHYRIAHVSFESPVRGVVGLPLLACSGFTEGFKQGFGKSFRQSFVDSCAAERTPEITPTELMKLSTENPDIFSRV